MRIRPPGPGHLVLLGLALLVLGPAGRSGRAEVSSEARTPGEIYERKRTLADEVLHVAGDLQVRSTADDSDDPAVLMLVVHPTRQTKDEIRVLAAGLPWVARKVEAGLWVGLVSSSGSRLAPSPDLTIVRQALDEMATRPVSGSRSVHPAIRAAVRSFPAGRGPRAVLLLADDDADAEDDVEATRNELLGVGASFYAIAPEAAFERPWLMPATLRSDPEGGFDERRQPSVRRRNASTLFYGCDVAYPLVPWSWEHRLAQLDFFWGKPPRYPVPSGFGVWSLATLAFATGGRYFIHDFRLPPVAKARGSRRERKLLYEISRLNLLAPDLRPRDRIRKDLSKDARARTILRIWDHLAEEASPVVGVRGVLELTAGALAERPWRLVRALSSAPVWYEEMDDVRKAVQYGERRMDRLALARRWWSQTNARPRDPATRSDPLSERLEADFQLLGLFLAQVRFQWLERRAALESIKPLHVSYRRVRLVPRVVAVDPDPGRPRVDLGDRERNLALAELSLARSRIQKKYRGTPWALLVEKQRIHTFERDVQVLDEQAAEEAERRRREEAKRRARAGANGGGEGGKPAPRLPAPGRPGPRPGSVGGGPATDGD